MNANFLRKVKCCTFYQLLNGVSSKQLQWLININYLLILLVVTIAMSPVRAQQVLLGLTATGGPNGAGTAFKIQTTGTKFKVLLNFTNAGKWPHGGLVKGSDGNFYGVTSAGGVLNSGTVFRMSSQGALHVLKNFDDPGGRIPLGSLTEGVDSLFYGITSKGGSKGFGTIFTISYSGVFSVIKNLDDSSGNHVNGSLLKGSDGNLYGMASRGGLYDNGTIFRITPDGEFTVLKSLNYITEGYNPLGSLVEGPGGYFYGVTNLGGANAYGTVFKISTAGSFTTLSSFDGLVTGGFPTGSLVLGTDGNFYGATPAGGEFDGGTIFKMSPGGTITVLKNLDIFTTGAGIIGTLVEGGDGDFYGMTSVSAIGPSAAGTVFKIKPTGEFTLLHLLDIETDGGNPEGRLYKDVTGYFYGMTLQGGDHQSPGCGTVFRISSSGTFEVLARFPDNGTGMNPQNSLAQDSNGYLYGTANQGGAFGQGTIFKLCDESSGVLRSFDNIHGSSPYGNLIHATDGYLYGTASSGGTHNGGTIFKITPGGDLTVLKNLDRLTTGSAPAGGLVQANDSNFYGLITFGGRFGFGTIVKLSPGGKFTVLKHFDNSTTGGYPYGNLIQATDGNLYGMTSSGGANGSGVIFRITLSGSFKVIKVFDYSNDGGIPHGSLLQGIDGHLYGITSNGGEFGTGTVFKFTTGGEFTVLKHLEAASFDFNAEGNLVQAADSALYGITGKGGTYNAGTIFRITPAGNFTTLHSFHPLTDGANPRGSLVIQKPDPIADSQSVSTVRNTPKVITLSGSGGTSLSFNILTQPVHGSLSGTGKTKTYVPQSNYVGIDSFKFQVTRGCQSSDTGLVVITITQVPGNISPVVKIETPARDTNFVVGESILVSADASDTDGTITSVDFFNGDHLIFTELKPPYSRHWNAVPTGSYYITAVATDNRGAKTTSARVHITVLHNRPPKVNITSPAEGDIFEAPSTIILGADAIAHGGKIKTVRFYQGATLIHTEENFPYLWEWKGVPAGSYTITAVATDTRNRTSVSAPIHISVNNRPLTMVRVVPYSHSYSTGINHQSKALLAPNPAKDMLHITLSGWQQVDRPVLSIQSLTGVIVKSIPTLNTNNVMQVDVSSLIAGTYIMSVTNRNKVIYKRFIKL